MSLTHKNKRRNEKMTNFITRDIEKKFVKKECENIWTKNCPRCNKLLSFSTKYNLQRSIDSGSLCQGCWNQLMPRIGKRQKTITEEDLKRMCPICKNEVIHTTKWVRDDAIRKNKVCKHCKPIIYPPTKERIEKQRKK